MLALLLALLCFQALAATLTGKVVKVADGDTITVLVDREQHRVRLAGIDAPERGQSHGKASGRALAALVAGKVVRVEYDKRDRYGRLVGVVFVPFQKGACPSSMTCPDEVYAGFNQIAAGLAWHFKRYESEQKPEDRITYAAASTSAPRCW